MKFYSATEKIKITSFAENWVLSKTSRIHRDKYQVSSLYEDSRFLKKCMPIMLTLGGLSMAVIRLGR